MVDSAIFTPPSWTEVIRLEDLFPSPAPLEVDVGCGKGRFLATHARAHPDVHFLGIDRLLRRIRKADRKVVRQELANVRLLRIEARYALECLLPAESVNTYYVFFPDPWPKRRHHRRRLLRDAFLDAVWRTLQAGGCVHLATDHGNYFEEMCAGFGAHAGFTEAPVFTPAEEEQTEFERTFLEQGETVLRCSYRKTLHEADLGGGVTQ